MSRRTQQPGCLYRFRPRLADHQSSGTLVTAAGQATSVHHAAKIHRALCASDESQVRFAAKDHPSWDPATAAGRGCQQAARGPGSPCPHRGADCLLDADEPVSPARPRPATPHVQWHVHGPPARGSSAVSDPTARICPSDEPDAGTGAPAAVCALAEPLCPSHHPGRSPTGFDHGSPEWRDPPDHSTRRQPLGPQCSHPVTTKSRVLPTAPRWICGRQFWRAAAPRQPCGWHAQSGLYPNPRGWCFGRRRLHGSEPVALTTMQSASFFFFSF